MTSIASLYGMSEIADSPENGRTIDWILPKQNIGIEIEVEHCSGKTQFSDRMFYWDQKGDGSLRNGREYVLRHPLNGNQLSAAISEFFDLNRTVRSTTSGTHIHLDMREKTTDLGVVQAMAAIMCCIEPAVFGMFAEGREWSGYTNPLNSLPDHAIGAALNDDPDAENMFRNVFNSSTREYKYYGLNFLPLGRFGSVEFRYFPTATNLDELVEWIQFCQAVKSAGVNIGSLAAFKQYVQGPAQWQEFLNRFFPMWYDRMEPFLPYNDVHRRYKTAKAQSRTSIPSKINKKLVLETSTNLNKTKKFKKFFAVKVKNKEGKYKLAYSKEDVRAIRPMTIYTYGVDSIDTVGENDLFLDSGALHQSLGNGNFRALFYYTRYAFEPNRVLPRDQVDQFEASIAQWESNAALLEPVLSPEVRQYMLQRMQQYLRYIKDHYSRYDGVLASTQPEQVSSEPDPEDFDDEENE